jgi:hypothetical protein
MNKTDFLFDEPSAPKPEAEKEWIGPRHLTASQAVALKRLADLARLRGQPDRGGVTLRNKPLIVGPSGSGKTALVRRLCDLEELPLLVVNAGGWLVHGCTSGPQTLSVIRRFVETNPEGCIFVDEIDKSVPGNSTFSHSWPLGVFTEILSLCDADGKLLTSGWQPEHVRRLSQSHFVVGAGTWQIHVAPKKKNDNEKDDDYIKRIAEKSGICDEILLRFHPELIHISQPTAKDLAQAIRRIRADLCLSALNGAEETRLGQEAAQTDFGMRWAEAYLADLLIKNPQLQKKRPAASVTVRDTIAISGSVFTQKMCGMFEQLDAMRKPAKELEVKLHLARMIATNSSAEQRKNFLDPAELSSIIVEIRGLISGLAYGLSATEQVRLKREAQAQVHGHNLLRLLDTWLQEKAFSMKSCGALEAAIQLEVQLRRVLETWRYLADVEVEA